jgi:hypothetical protein
MSLNVKLIYEGLRDKWMQSSEDECKKVREFIGLRHGNLSMDPNAINEELMVLTFAGMLIMLMNEGYEVSKPKSEMGGGSVTPSGIIVQ